MSLRAARSQTHATQRKVAELKALLNTGKVVADALGFDEATTRKRLIDTGLSSVGWDVGINGGETQEVTQEEQILHQPTETGTGFADYVLWDDNGLPLAVVEVKKTSKRAELGQEQARVYADGLEEDARSTAHHLLYQWIRHFHMGRCPRISAQTNLWLLFQGQPSILDISKG